MTSPSELGYLPVQCIFDGLALNDPASGYRLEATSREETQVSFRKQEVSSPFVEGTYLINAVRENVVENIGVWVSGVSPAELDRRIEVLLEKAEKPRFTVVWGKQQVNETWTCQTASYTVRTQREYQHALVALVKMQVPRLPRVARSYTDGKSPAAVSR